MKRILRTIIKSIIRASSHVRVLFDGKQGRTSVSRAAASKRPRKRTFLTKKVIVICAGALAVITAVVLSVVLTSADTDTAADAQAALVSTGEAPAASVAAPAPEAPIVSAQIASAADSAPIPTTTTPPSAIQTTQPDVTELVRDCYDPRVVEIQEKLMALGYMPSDEPNDYYGYTTWYALQLFQRKHSLGVDGLAGDNTLAMLFSDDAKPYTVKLGDTGTDIEEMQDRLRSLNYLDTRSTGYFGTDTEDAVKEFQDRNGLYADGNIGEQTYAILYSDSAREARESSSGGGSSGGGSGGSGDDDDDDGGSSSPPPPVYIEGDPTPDKLIEYAKTKLGCDYNLGSKGPDRFDCSGFVYYCLNQIGFKIRYMTSTTWRSVNFKTIKDMHDMQKGDIICFTPHHVGIYMGGGDMIDASSSNDAVVIRKNILNSNYWTRNFVCAKRVF